MCMVLARVPGARKEASSGGLIQRRHMTAARILTGDALTVLRTLPEESVNPVLHTDLMDFARATT